MRNRRNHAQKRNNNHRFVFWLKIIFCFLLIVFCYKTVTLFVELSKTIRSDEKIILAVRQENDDVHVHIIDPKIRSYNILDIPSETLTDASNGLGEWRLGALWKLGLNDNVGGEYMRKSLTRDFNIPVVFWSDFAGEAYATNNVPGKIKIVSGRYLTNMRYSDRLALLFFSFKIPESGRKYTDLKETSFLTSSKLPDGEEGYIVEDTFPVFLLPLFSQDKFANMKIKLVSAGLKDSEIKNISKTIEVMGGKVAFIERKEEKDIVCEVWSEDEKLRKKIISIYSCQEDLNVNKSGFDLVITLGKRFTSLN